MRVFLPGDIQALLPVEVNFGNWLRLAGVRADCGAASLHLYLRWQCLRKSYRRWRCFVHVFAGARRISSLDHALLAGRPPLPSWDPGDEGYERIDHWWGRRPETLGLRLGLYDPEINVRCPILASTLPVCDDSTAAAITPGEIPGGGYTIRFPSPPLARCGIVFQDELELTAWSAARCGDLVWLRLKWTLRGRPPRRLRFFGHAVAEPTHSAPTLGQFDQEMPLECRGPATCIEQNVTARIAAPEARWLRAGVATEPDVVRRRIVRGPGPYDLTRSCFYRPLAPAEA